MLHFLANEGGYVGLKRAAAAEGWRHRKKDVKNVLYSRRLLMMTMMIAHWQTSSTRKQLCLCEG